MNDRDKEELLAAAAWVLRVGTVEAKQHFTVLYRLLYRYGYGEAVGELLRGHVLVQELLC